MPSSNIQSPTVYFNRRWTHHLSSIWQPPQEGRIHQPVYGKINRLPAYRKNSIHQVDKTDVSSTTIIHQYLRNTHMRCTQIRISDRIKRRILQGRLKVSSTNHRRSGTKNTPNRCFLYMSSKPQGPRLIYKWTGRHIPRCNHSRRNHLEIQHPRSCNNDSMWWP